MIVLPQSQTTHKNGVNIQINDEWLIGWRQACSWSWLDALRTTPTNQVYGADLRVGDRVVLAGTVIELRKVINTDSCFGRRFQRFEYECVSAPTPTIASNVFYFDIVYKVLPKD